ncbi:MAG TPA: DUF6077 domain-containing protein [Gaiellaceae bacterium]|nr:DUF6077 domain-containing protein [Gaiellaceae bacterium]
MRAGRSFQLPPAGIARGCDGLLDFVVLALAAWTVVYHACVVLGIDAVWALIAWAAGLVASAWIAFRRDDDARPTHEPSRPAAWPPSRLALALCGYSAAVGLSAAVYAFAEARWAVVWLLLFLTAAAGTGLAYLRATGRLRLDLAADGARAWPGTVVAFVWAAGLAVFSLLFVRPDADDTQYVHLSTWIAEHGSFPLRDTLFSDEVFPAIIYPPISSFEALIGSLAGAVGVSAAGVTYLVVTPLATVLGVLATWRLLRAWKVPLVGLALTTAMVFLVIAAEEHRTLGNLFVGRIWQGKIILLVVLVPVLFVLAQEYSERPTRRALVLLAAAGAAGVGLTSSGTFVLLALGAGCLAPLALRSVREAALGLAAVAAYPLGALVVTAAAGQRRAGEDFSSDVATGEIARIVLGSGFLAFVAVAAALIGPPLIADRRAALMAASTVLLVAVLYAPPVPPFIWEVTGIGRVLWRVVWIVPVAALVGVAVTALPPRAGPAVLRALPAGLLCVALIVWGSPIWDAGTVRSEPSWKRPPETLTAARRILARAEPGDVVLAPQQVAQTLLIMSGNVTTVSPRVFYTRALEDVPEAFVQERLLLQSILEPELVATVTGVSERPRDESAVGRALRLVGVDVACVESRRLGALETLQAAGYSPTFRTAGLTCLQPPS